MKMCASLLAQCCNRSTLRCPLRVLWIQRSTFIVDIPSHAQLLVAQPSLGLFWFTERFSTFLDAIHPVTHKRYRDVVSEPMDLVEAHERLMNNNPSLSGVRPTPFPLPCLHRCVQE